MDNDKKKKIIHVINNIKIIEDIFLDTWDNYNFLMELYSERSIFILNKVNGRFFGKIQDFIVRQVYLGFIKIYDDDDKSISIKLLVSQFNSINSNNQNILSKENGEIRKIWEVFKDDRNKRIVHNDKNGYCDPYIFKTKEISRMVSLIKDFLDKIKFEIIKQSPINKTHPYLVPTAWDHGVGSHVMHVRSLLIFIENALNDNQEKYQSDNNPNY